jgi:hypothetical protein
MKLVLKGLKHVFQATVKGIMKGIQGTLRLIWRTVSGFVRLIGKAVWYSAKGIWNGIKWSLRAITSSRLALWIKAKRAASAARWARWMRALKNTKIVRGFRILRYGVHRIWRVVGNRIGVIRGGIARAARRISLRWTRMKDVVKAFPGKV